MDRRIMIVDSDEKTAQIVSLEFTKFDYSVTTAGNLELAKQHMEADPPDLIMLETRLPDGSGLDFCKQVRQVSEVPILFLTCQGGKDELLSGLRAGADEYLQKPCDMDVLLTRVAVLLRRRELDGRRGTSEISIGPLYIDVISRKVYVGNRNIKLASKEFGLLLALMKNQNRICSPDELYYTVWGLAETRNINTVRVHMANLRKKLQLYNSSKLEIVNIYSRGYQLRSRSS